jgi:hypothetical protein
MIRETWKALGALACAACAVQPSIDGLEDADAGGAGDAALGTTVDAGRDGTIGPTNHDAGVVADADDEAAPDDAGVDAEPCVVVDGAACVALENPCTCQAQCCGAPAVTCDHVGGLLVRWCCVPAGGACTKDNDCCGQHICTTGDGGAKACQ